MSYDLNSNPKRIVCRHPMNRVCQLEDGCYQLLYKLPRVGKGGDDYAALQEYLNAQRQLEANNRDRILCATAHGDKLMTVSEDPTTDSSVLIERRFEIWSLREPPYEERPCPKAKSVELAVTEKDITELQEMHDAWRGGGDKERVFDDINDSVLYSAIEWEKERSGHSADVVDYIIKLRQAVLEAQKEAEAAKAEVSELQASRKRQLEEHNAPSTTNATAQCDSHNVKKRRGSVQTDDLAGFVYTLRIHVENERFRYVGATERVDNPFARIHEHGECGRSCAKHLPAALSNAGVQIFVEDLHSVAGNDQALMMDENQTVLQCINKHGFRNVRGGVFCSTVFGDVPPTSEVTLFRAMANLSYRTGLHMRTAKR